MIGGTIILEDTTLHFERAARQDGKVLVTVVDTLSGATRKLEVNPRGFAASLALAMDFDGFDSLDGSHGELQTKLYELAEPVVEGLPGALRWFP